jgi:type II secretion system protein C
MQKLSNTKLITLASKLLVLLLLAKLISLGVWWYLPSEGVELEAKKSYQPTYQRVTFHNMLRAVKRDKGSQHEEGEMSSSSTSSSYTMSNFILKGIYGSRFSGYAIIAKKSTPNDADIVAVDDIYEGYILKEIALSEVVFVKDKKEYKLRLEESSAKLFQQIEQMQTQDGESGQKEVTRADIQTYSQNPALIWKDIGIQEVKEGTKIVGFKVTRVKAGSKMATLGLMKDDLIIKANNIALSSLNDVLKLYKDIDKIETLALTILRNNQEQEIVYEIR